jgi:hypothetical protein
MEKEGWFWVGEEIFVEEEGGSCGKGSRFKYAWREG